MRAGIFIDCSGDGDLAAWAGAPFEVGDDEGSMLYPSMMFRLNGIDPERAGDAWRTIPALMEKARSRRHAQISAQGRDRAAAEVRNRMAGEFHAVGAQDGSAINGLEPDELTRGEIEGRRQAVEAFEFLRTVPGFEKSYIVDLPPQLGIRETRRVIGGYSCQRRGRARLRARSRIPSASMAGRWSTMSPATSMLQFPPIPAIARLQRIALSDAGAAANRQSCWWPGDAPR